jgi:hypothetical protein
MKQITHFVFILFTVLGLMGCGDIEGGQDDFSPSASELDFVVWQPKDYFEFKQTSGTATSAGSYLLVVDLTDITIQNYLKSGCLSIIMNSMRYQNGEEVSRRKDIDFSNDDGDVYSEEQYFGNENETAEFAISPTNAVTANATLYYRGSCTGQSLVVANDRVDL